MEVYGFMKKTYVSPEFDFVSLSMSRLLNDDVVDLSYPQIPSEGHADGDEY